MLASVCAILFAATGLSGCATDEGLRPSTPAALSQTSQSMQEPFGAWPSDRWWEALGDPQLNALVTEALRQSPTFRQALDRMKNAETLAAAAVSPLLPQITANAASNDQKQSYNNGIPPLFVPKGYNAGGRTTLDISYDLDIWGKNLALLRAAKLEAQASSVDAASARLALSSTIVATYCDLAQAYQDRDVAERVAALRGKTADLVRQRLSAGLDARIASRQSDATQRTSQADLLAIDETIGLLRDRLAALLGAGPDRGIAIARPAKFIAGPLTLPQTLATDLISRRPDVAAARYRAEEAAQRVHAAHADYYPNINLAAFVGNQSLKLADLSKSGSSIGSVSPAIHLPIFDRARIYANYKVASNDYASAVAAYDQSVIAAVQEVADLVTSRRTIDLRLEQVGASYAASEDARKLAEVRFQAGLTPLTTVLAAEDQALGAQRALLALQSRQIALDISLVRALGGGFHDAR